MLLQIGSTNYLYYSTLCVNSYGLMGSVTALADSLSDMSNELPSFVVSDEVANKSSQRMGSITGWCLGVLLCFILVMHSAIKHPIVPPAIKNKSINAEIILCCLFSSDVNFSPSFCVPGSAKKELNAPATKPTVPGLFWQLECVV